MSRLMQQCIGFFPGISGGNGSDVGENGSLPLSFFPHGGADVGGGGDGWNASGGTLSHEPGTGKFQRTA